MADNKLKQFNKIKVLIVEDIPEDAQLMKRELEILNGSICSG